MTTGTPRHTWTDNATAITAAKLNETEQDVADALATANANTTALAGKANTSHTHSVTDLTATGTPSSSTFLRGDNTWATSSVSYTDEQAQDAAAQLFTGGTHTGIAFSYNDAANRIDATVSGGYTDEQVRDVMGTALVAGSNVTVTPNDGADTITIAASSAFVTPMAYGAVGDGTTDDSTAVQSAFDSGRPVLIDRTYLVGGLTAASGLAVHGSPGGVLKRKSTSTYTISINPGSGGSADPSTNITGVQFVGLSFDDNVATNTFRQGDAQLNLNACSDVLVMGCTFKGFRSDAIYLGSSNVGSTERHNQRVKIIGCWFDGVNKDNRNAISIIDCDDLVIDNCTFRRMTRSDMPGPIDIESNPGNAFPILRNFKIMNNTFDDIGGWACIGLAALSGSSLFTTAPGNWLIYNNTFRNILTGNAPVNLGFGGNVSTSTPRMDIRVIQNTFYNVPRYLNLNGVRGITFKDNVIAGSTGAGMVGSTYSVLDITFDSNRFVQVGSGDGGAPAAITVVNATYVKIDGNEFVDCGLTDGTWGMCVVLGGPGASDYVEFVGTNTMRPGTRMTAVSYKSSSHTKGTHNAYTAPIGAVGTTDLP